jgi:DNA-binding Lrp family transcriptional regulator
VFLHGSLETTMKVLEERLVARENEALAVLKQRGSVDTQELAEVLGITRQAAARVLERLKAQHHIHERRAGRYVSYVYGGMPAPKREPVEYKPFSGVNWANSTMRPGCQDFLKAPSLVHGERVEHRAPIHGCVSSAPQVRSEA